MSTVSFDVESSPCQVTNTLSLDELFDALATGNQVAVEFMTPYCAQPVHGDLKESIDKNGTRSITVTFDARPSKANVRVLAIADESYSQGGPGRKHIATVTWSESWDGNYYGTRHASYTADIAVQDGVAISLRQTPKN